MNDFARKAVHWTKEDVAAAAAVLRKHEWNLTRINVKRFVAIRVFAETFLPELTTTKLLQRLDWDSSAAESLLIFVHSFRCLIEGESDAKDMSNLSSTVQGTTNWSQDMQQS